MEVGLQRDQPVVVVLDDGRRLAACVTALEGDHVDLGLRDGPVELPGQARWCSASIWWTTRLGAAQRHGIVAVGADGGLRLHAHRDATPIQRRDFVRVPAELSTAVIGRDGRLVTRTVDVSIGGMLLAAGGPIAPQDQVRFALDLGPLTISGDGEVIRGTVDGPCAVRFAALQGRVERALAQYVAQRQRQLIAGSTPRP